MSYDGNYGNLPEYDEEEEQEQHSCEILDTSRYVSGGSPSDDESSEEYDYDFNIQDLQSPKAAATAATTDTYLHFDLTDPSGIVWNSAKSPPMNTTNGKLCKKKKSTSPPPPSPSIKNAP